MTSFLSAAANAATAKIGDIGSALAPTVEFSLPDLLDEISTLREENAALKAQVSILSNVPDQQDGSTPAARSQLEAEKSCLLTMFRAEVALLEDSAECARVQGDQRIAELAMRCDELGRVLDQRLLLAEQQSEQASAMARQHSAEAVARLEEQVEELSEALAQRDALAADYGAESELADAEQRAVDASLRSERKAAECDALREELSDLQRKHTDELHAVRQEAEKATADAANAARSVATSESVVSQLQAQLVRLSEGFNKQVEEVLAVRQELEQTRQATVDKATARGWVVNYVEASNSSSSHGDELLRLMAEWWGFSDHDLSRVGLGGAHPSREALLTPTEASISDAFASFLDARSTPPSSPVRK